MILGLNPAVSTFLLLGPVLPSAWNPVTSTQILRHKAQEDAMGAAHFLRYKPQAVIGLKMAGVWRKCGRGLSPDL